MCDVTKVQLIYWRDIPAQVRVKNGRFRMSKLLSPRFQKTIHRAAFRAKAINGSAYTDSWRSVTLQLDENDAETAVNQIAAKIEAVYTDERLDRLARSKGIETVKPDKDIPPTDFLA